MNYNEAYLAIIIFLLVYGIIVFVACYMIITATKPVKRDFYVPKPIDYQYAGRKVPDFIAAYDPTATMREITTSAQPAQPATEMDDPSFDQLTANALAALRALDDWTNENETQFTGWGDGDVPPTAEFWRVKSGQALKALQELPAPSAQIAQAVQSARLQGRAEIEAKVPVKQIEALLDLDARGALTPHGIGGLAASLFRQVIWAFTGDADGKNRAK